MNNILLDLRDAIERINESYYYSKQTIYENGELIELSDDYVVYEDRFVTQLISQYNRTILLAPDEYENCITDGFVRKAFLLNNEGNYYKSTYSKLKNKSPDLFDEIITKPDFIVHLNENDLLFENQKLAVEVKSTKRLRKNDFNIDLFKLNIYADLLNFQNSVYIILENDYDKIKKKVKKYYESRYYLTDNNADKIHFFIKPNLNSGIQICSLNEILIELNLH